MDKAGVGSAVLNASRQVGGSLGIALIGAIMAAEAGGRGTPEAFVEGLKSGLLVASGIAALGAAVAFATVRPHEAARGAARHGAVEPAA